jgi:putative two-component system protein, hydrogenase maturation factor HypX/HoxX
MPDGLLERKRSRRARDEWVKPLQAYRNEELARSHECFYGADRSYHEARRSFCRKLGDQRSRSAQSARRSSRLSARQRSAA